MRTSVECPIDLPSTLAIPSSALTARPPRPQVIVRKKSLGNFLQAGIMEASGIVGDHWPTGRFSANVPR